MRRAAFLLLSASRVLFSTTVSAPSPQVPPTMLLVKKLSENAVLPVRGSALAAGFDLASAESVVVPARGKAIVKTDLAVATPLDCYARIAPRSGLAAKKFIDVGAGVVDADYRGNVGVILFNFGEQDFAVAPGDRVAQLILEKVHLNCEVAEVPELPDTERGAGGFGSTGVTTTANGASSETPNGGGAEAAAPEDASAPKRLRLNSGTAEPVPMLPEAARLCFVTQIKDLAPVVQQELSLTTLVALAQHPDKGARMDAIMQAFQATGDQDALAFALKNVADA